MNLMQTRIVVAHLEAIMSNIISNILSYFMSNLFEFLLFKWSLLYYINPMNSLQITNNLKENLLWCHLT